uniref:CCR4-NOT transcription complex subunit 1 domain-containing protein n=1 Tax=Ditylenchus dipsaci TaxID=166011 RepID=A0A915D060_9BILA
MSYPTSTSHWLTPNFCRFPDDLKDFREVDTSGVPAMLDANSATFVPKEPVPRSLPNPGSALLNVTNVDTLVYATKIDGKQIEAPPQVVFEKISFMFNNLSESIFRARQTSSRRSSHNTAKTYCEFGALAWHNYYRKRRSNFGERVGLKLLLLDAFYKGQQDLFVCSAFVSKPFWLAAKARCSSQSALGYLASSNLAHSGDQADSLSMQEPSLLPAGADHVSLFNGLSLESSLHPERARYHFDRDELMRLLKDRNFKVVNPSAVHEIIGGISERSISIAMTVTEHICHKDFSMSMDEELLLQACHQMIPHQLRVKPSANEDLKVYNDFSRRICGFEPLCSKMPIKICPASALLSC